MLTLYDTTGSALSRREGIGPITETTLWIDLYDPSPEEERYVEAQLAINVPTRAEMREIEVSSRLYVEQGAYFMTAFIVHKIEDPTPASSTLTFILAGKRLVTVRYSEPKAIPLYLQRIEMGDAVCHSAPAVLVGLLETLVHRLADLIERIQDEADQLAQAIFAAKGGRQTRERRLDVLLKRTGNEGDLVARAQESAMSLDRVLRFFAKAAKERQDEEEIRHRIDSVVQDVASLVEHMHFLADRIVFLLDATLGAITTEQNQVIKLFSVMAVLMMPPTLVASIYGMNFRHMPELDWVWGYPSALLLMLASAVIPFAYFRRKGWL